MPASVSLLSGQAVNVSWVHTDQPENTLCLATANPVQQVPTASMKR